jgi:hypothetical protein
MLHVVGSDDHHLRVAINGVLVNMLLMLVGDVGRYKRSLNFESLLRGLNKFR